MVCRWPDLSFWGPGDESGRPPRCLFWCFLLFPSLVSRIFVSETQRGGGEMVIKAWPRIPASIVAPGEVPERPGQDQDVVLVQFLLFMG